MEDEVQRRDEDFNASCARVGLRSEPVLTVGVSLWAALSPAGLLALLGHELGHLVNGDPDQLLLTQPALRTFAQLASVLNPRAVEKTLFMRRIAWVVLGPAWLMCTFAQLRLWRLASRDHVRAEIHADVRAVQLGGTEGAEELGVSLLVAESITTNLRRVARTDGSPKALLDAARTARAKSPERLTTYEQHSLRTEASLFASHPPSGMRLRLVRAWGTQKPAASLDTDRSAMIDRELADAYRRTLKALEVTG